MCLLSIWQGVEKVLSVVRENGNRLPLVVRWLQIELAVRVMSLHIFNAILSLC